MSSYEIVDTERGDVIGTFSTCEEAQDILDAMIGSGLDDPGDYKVLKFAYGEPATREPPRPAEPDEGWTLKRWTDKWDVRTHPIYRRWVPTPGPECRCTACGKRAK